MPKPATPPKDSFVATFPMSFTIRELMVIREMAINEAKRVSDLFGSRLPEFPDVCQHVESLGKISHATVAALAVKR